jgi:hypothetical protein
VGVAEVVKEQWPENYQSLILSGMKLGVFCSQHAEIRKTMRSAINIPTINSAKNSLTRPRFKIQKYILL